MNTKISASYSIHPFIFIIILAHITADQLENMIQFNTPTFPTLQAERLTGQTVTFPDDLTEEVNILIVAFDQKAQQLVDSWGRLILAKYEPQPNISYHEVPMISGWYRPMAGQIDRWMRQGIPAQYHENTVTFYGNRAPYMRELRMTRRNSCYVFVLDRKGQIVYRAEGMMDGKKERKLRAIINAMLS